MRHTEHRQWLRLLGRRADVQIWSADPRRPALGERFARPYKGGLGLHGGEAWILPILDPIASKHLAGVELFLPRDDCGKAPFAVLQGVCSRSGGPQGAPSSASLREVVVFRQPPSAQVYVVTSHGRRCLRQLAASSADSTSLAVIENRTGMPLMKEETDVAALQTALLGTQLTSVLVLRSVGAATQEFVPPRFLRGALPDALVEQYTFWQSSEPYPVIVGYPRVTQKDRSRDPSKQLTFLFVRLHADGRDAVAVVKRAALQGWSERDSAEAGAMAGLPLDALAAQADDGGHTLLNVSHCPHVSTVPALRHFAAMLGRLDDPSHWLVWTKRKVGGPEDTGGEIDLIELPRLGLAFRSFSETAGGRHRLWCDQHPGLFISSRGGDPTAASAMRGLPHAVLLEDAFGSLFVLVTATAAPRRPPFRGALVPAGVVMDRGLRTWVDNIDASRHYLYPLHSTGGFLQVPTLAGALHLFMVRFLTGNFKAAFDLAPACVSDERLSAEEEQLFRRFPVLEDAHAPDAVAVRLRWVLAGQLAGMEGPWDVARDVFAYVARAHCVSVDCRLTMREEESLLAPLVNANSAPELKNRLMVLRLHLEARASGALPLKPIDTALTLPHVPALPSFDGVEDRSWLDAAAWKEKDASLLQKISASYTRPEADQLTGEQAMRRVSELCCEYPSPNRSTSRMFGEKCPSNATCRAVRQCTF